MDSLGFNFSSFFICIMSYVIFLKTRGKNLSNINCFFFLLFATFVICFFHPLTVLFFNNNPLLWKVFLFDFLGTLLVSLAFNITLLYLYKKVRK